MDCPNLSADHMYPSSAPHHSCTTQSASVNNPGPGFADGNTMVTMSPQQMSQAPQIMVQYQRQPLPPSPAYSSQAHISSYTSSEQLGYEGSPHPSQQIVVRQQTWSAPQAATWAGEAPNYTYSDAGLHRAQTWSSYNQASVQPWVPQEHNQQVALRGHTGYQQPLSPATIAQLNSYSQEDASINTGTPSYYAYPSMSPGISQQASFPMTDSPNASGTMVRYPDSRFGTPTSPPTGMQAIPRASTAQMSSPQSEGVKSPATPASRHSEESTADHYPDPEAPHASPSGDQDMKASGVPSESDDKKADTPYAQLIYQALLSRPNHAMRLQEIYQWFLENTNKGKNGSNGWQNSIRHNLSMNAAFERRPTKTEDNGDGPSSPSGGSNKVAAEWVLLDSAIENGLLSTTRYRNSERRSQNSRARTRSSRVNRSFRRPGRAMTASGSLSYTHYVPQTRQHFDRHDYRPRSHHLKYGQRYGHPQYESLAEQMGRASLGEQQQRAMYFATVSGPDYEKRVAMQQNNATYAPPPPLMYPPQLFMNSSVHPGPPTVASIESDNENEVMTPEPQYAAMEPTVLLPGDHHGSSPTPGGVGPTSNPYSNGPSAYYSSQQAGTAPRYTLSDLAGVAEEEKLNNSCNWNVGNQHHQYSPQP